MNNRNEHQTLLYSDIYSKISVKFVFEGVKFILQLNCLLFLRVNKDVLDLSQLISHELT